MDPLVLNLLFLTVIEREKARQRMRSCAAITLVLWWRRMKGRKLTARQSKIDKVRRIGSHCTLQFRVLVQLSDRRRRLSSVAVSNDNCSCLVDLYWPELLVTHTSVTACIASRIPRVPTGNYARS